jgi:hypothetical protein
MFVRGLGSGSIGRMARNSFFVSRRGINTRECNYANMFSSLKNNFLGSSVVSVSNLAAGCVRLQDAIVKGNAEHSVFWEKDCSLYLLGLMHFTSLQPLRREDDLLKTHCEYEVKNLVSAGGLTWLAKDYLHSVVAGFKRFGVVIDYDDLCHFVLSLPAAEQWLLRLTYRVGECQYINQDYDVMMNILSNTVPFLSQLEFDVCYLPGMGVINYLFSKMTVEPVRLQPIFGSVGDEVFHLMHSNNMHPGGLYHPLIAENQLSAHGLKVGPVGLFVHDLAHMFWINLFSPEELRHIYRVVVPEINRLIAEASSIDYSYTTGLLVDTKNKLIDFDLHLNIEEYFMRESRFERYMGQFEYVLEDSRRVLGGWKGVRI